MSVSTLAHSIADDIERFGHYQETVVGKGNNDLNGHDQPEGACCVVANPSVREARRGDGRWSRDEPWGFYRALREKIASKTGEDWQSVCFVSWSDETDTAEVIATLRSL